MRNLKRKLLSQNFLRNQQLVRSLVETSSIGKNDLVLEIGPGKGIITTELVTKAQHVIGVELDPSLCMFLNEKFGSTANFSLHQADILSFNLPRLPYKVFANIPFAIEGQIVRKLLDSPNPPKDCYLVIVKSLAERLSGKLGNNLFSITHKPWFDFSICHTFNRWDFTDSPNIESVLWRVTHKQNPDLPFGDRASFTRFVHTGFGNGQSVYRNLVRILPKTKLTQIMSRGYFSKNTLPSALNLEAWLNIYKLVNI